MKRVISTIFLLIATGVVGLGQTGVFSGIQVKRAEYDLRKTGWVIRPEIGMGYYDDYFDRSDQLFLQISANTGYQFTPHIYLGVGIKPVLGLMKYYHHNAGTYGRDAAISLYTNFRWHWFDGLKSPYMELDAGMFSAFDEFHKAGLLLSPAIGCNIKNYDIKISIPVISYNRKAYFYSSYDLGDWRWYRQWGVGICFTIGYYIMANKNN